MRRGTLLVPKIVQNRGRGDQQSKKFAKKVPNVTAHLLMILGISKKHGFRQFLNSQAKGILIVFRVFDSFRVFPYC